MNDLAAELRGIKINNCFRSIAAGYKPDPDALRFRD